MKAMSVSLLLLVTATVGFAVAQNPLAKPARESPRGGCCPACQASCPVGAQDQVAATHDSPAETAATEPVVEPQGRGRGFGRGAGGQGRGARGRGGPGQDEQFVADRDVFHSLLSNREKIDREVKNLENGVETVTQSDDPEITKLIQTHVQQMYRRVENAQPIHLRDPLFRAIFQQTDKIKMTMEKTEKGIRVQETSDDPFVAKLIQAHAKVVSLFVANGHDEVRQNHDVPQRD